MKVWIIDDRDSKPLPYFKPGDDGKCAGKSKNQE
jgi:hypothetical protein